MFISLPLPLLHALVLFTPTNTLHPWMCGVNFRAEGGCLLVSATDGVAALQARVLAADAPAGFNRTAPTAFIKSLPKRGEAVLAFGGDDLSVSAGSVTATGKLLPASYIFPSLRRAAPAPEQAGKPAEFDFEQLARFSKAAKLAGWGSPRLHMHGDRAGVVGFGEDDAACGLLSPWLSKDGKGKVRPLPTVPEWFA